MNRGIVREVGKLAALGALLCYARRKDRAAGILGLAALGTFLIPRSYSYSGRVVMITGGSRGLGLALARRLLREGARVVLLARDRSELVAAHDQLLSEIPSAQVLTVACDVKNRDQFRKALQKTMREFGDVDVLINNAGSVAAGPFESMNKADFEAQMDLHFFAALNTTREILSTFKARGEGRIVNITSVGGRIPVPHMSSYCASKFALSGFSKALGYELSKDGILVSTVYPGLMRTGSPIQGVFKGDTEKEFAWFALSDNTPGLSVSADHAARVILDGVRAGQSEIVVSLPAKIGIAIHGLFPEIFHAVMAWTNRILPQEQTRIRRTGAASRAWLDGQAWTKPWRQAMAKAGENLNQTPKLDADFNLNV